jgi:hypothetical protein
MMAVNVKAQEELCACRPTTTTQTLFFVACSYYFEQGTPGVPDYIKIEVPSAWLRVNIIQQTCNGRTITIISDVGFIDNQQFYDDNEPYKTIFPNQRRCTFDTLTANELLESAAKELSLAGYIVGGVITYPKGCQASVKVQWPSGTTMYQPGNADGQPARYYPMSVSYQTVPCDKVVCCGSSVAPNGDLIGIFGGGPEACDGSEPIINGPFVIHSQDSTGRPLFFSGTIEKVNNCEAICYAIPSQGRFTTDLLLSQQELNNKEQNVDLPLELNITPTLAKDYILFDTEANITLVEVYDNQGKKVLETTKLENHKLKIDLLNSGIHYVFVHLDNNTLRTIKIVKQ